MILSDNETKIDMLNNKAIAKQWRILFVIVMIVRSLLVFMETGVLVNLRFWPWLRMSLIQHLIKMIKLYVFVLMAGNIKVLKMQK